MPRIDFLTECSSGTPRARRFGRKESGMRKSARRSARWMPFCFSKRVNAFFYPPNERYGHLKAHLQAQSVSFRHFRTEVPKKDSARKTVAIPPETHLLSYPPDKFGKFCREVGTFSTESADVFRQRSARFSAKAPTPHPLHKPSEWDTCLLSLGNYL